MNETQFTEITKKLGLSEPRKFAAYNKVFSKELSYRQLQQIFGVDKRQIHRDVKTIEALYEWVQQFAEAKG